MLRNITSIILTFVRIFSMLGVIFNCAQAVNTSLHKSLLGHCRRKCSTVSTAVLHSGHLSDSTTFIMARYSLTQHLPKRSLEIVTSVFRFLCSYLICQETVGSMFIEMSMLTVCPHILPFIYNKTLYSIIIF